jgi:hypothetical protein
MKTFLLDLWHDLREKRLWPVAVALLAGLVAVPFVLAKPAEDPPAPVAQQAAPAVDETEKTLAVKALDPASLPASDLDTYSTKNPFKPLIKAPKVKIGETESLDVTLGGGGGESIKVDETIGGGGGGVTVETDTGTGETGEGDGKKTTTQYAYVVDVTVTTANRTRRINGLQRLEMLPNEATPLLIFMGVSADGGNAVFMVDSTLKGAGEGTCKPSNDECAFAHVGAGSEFEFTDEEGNSLGIRVDEIRRVRVRAKRSSKKGDAKAGASDVTRRFMPPVLADLVSVSTAPGNDSNGDRARR